MRTVDARGRWGRPEWMVVASAAGLLALAGCDAVLGIPDDLHPSGVGGSAGSGGSMGTGATGGVMKSGATLAMHKLLLGDTLPTGEVSEDAWKGYGFNLDGKVSTTQSKDLCKPAAGAIAADVYPDGADGIDNSFGRVLLPIYQQVVPDLSTQINDTIANGTFTVLMHIGGLEPDGKGNFASGAYVGAMASGTSPMWMGMDKWKIRSDCLVAGDLSTPIALFPTSQVTDGADGQRVYLSVKPSEISLSLQVAGVNLVVPIRNTRISMVLSSDNRSAIGGQVGGVINTEDLLAESAKVIGSVDPNFCPGSGLFDSFATSIRQASDILADGTQDPNKTCDGISIGLGFEADAAQLGYVTEPPVTPDPCQK